MKKLDLSSVDYTKSTASCSFVENLIPKLVTGLILSKIRMSTEGGPARTIFRCCLSVIWIFLALNFWIYAGHFNYIFSCDMIGNDSARDKLVFLFITYNSIIFICGTYGLIQSDDLAIIMSSIAALTAVYMKGAGILNTIAPGEKQRQLSFSTCIKSKALRSFEIRLGCCGLKSYKDYYKNNFTEVPVSCCGIDIECTQEMLEVLPGCEEYFASIHMPIIIGSIETIFLTIMGLVGMIVARRIEKNRRKAKAQVSFERTTEAT